MRVRAPPAGPVSLARTPSSMRSDISVSWVWAAEPKVRIDCASVRSMREISASIRARSAGSALSTATMSARGSGSTTARVASASAVTAAASLVGSVMACLLSAGGLSGVARTVLAQSVRKNLDLDLKLRAVVGGQPGALFGETRLKLRQQ